MKNTTPLERDEQIPLVSWLEIKGLKFTAIPNSTYTTSWKQKKFNTNMGLRKGFPDLIIVIPKKKCKFGRTVMLCIEMKRQKGSYTYPEQKEWIRILNQITDVESRVCKGYKQATQYIRRFLV